MAFVVAAIVFVIGILGCALGLLATGMSDAYPKDCVKSWMWLAWCTMLALLIAGSHWVVWSW